MSVWEPRPESVKSLIPQRVGGRPFSATSTPTEGEVAQLVAMITGEVTSYVKLPIVAGCEGLASFAVAVKAAAEVERALFPEQALQPGSQYQLLKDRAAELTSQLYFCVNGAYPVDPGADGAMSSLSPRGHFPVPLAPGAPAPVVPDEGYVPLSTIDFTGSQRWWRTQR